MKFYQHFPTRDLADLAMRALNADPEGITVAVVPAPIGWAVVDLATACELNLGFSSEIPARKERK